PDLEEIVRAAEDQCCIHDADGERHADAEANVLLKTRCAGKALARMDDLRKTARTRIEPGPGLAPGREVFGYGHDARYVDRARCRQRAAHDAQQLGQEPSQTAQIDFAYLADVDGCRAVGEAL